jgi:formylglycine-generating enzyme required for sulfatase activity
MEMITVPSGAFSMGITEQQIQFLLPHSAWAAYWLEKGFFSREQPAHELILAPYSIGKYPVTVGDYQAFVEDGGYAKPRYWTNSGWVWLHDEKKNKPAYWSEIKWTADPQLPVVGVSWYEAFAFCTWLSKLAGKPFRLPTEAEWEKAARWPDSRLYPRGDRFEAHRCNIRPAGKGRTSPVGSYSPAGDSSCGCCEMAGNVSEWTLSKFMPYPYQTLDNREDPEGTAERVTRGGSWHSLEARARATSRGMNDPWFQDYDLGFRVVQSD